MKTIPRINDIYRPESVRTADFNDVERTLAKEELTEQASRCMDCGIPFCHGLGCPLENVIPEMNEAAGKENWQEAWNILSSTSLMPEFTSRVCPALCENTCTKNIEGAPVMIRQVEKCVSDKAFELGLANKTEQPFKTDKKAAVIGAGPAGLYMAESLFRAGHSVTVFEKNSYAGGLMRYGIPDFKLEKHIIERRVRLMKESGIRFQFDTEIGKDISADYLKKKFDAIVVAIGTPIPRDLQIPGRELKNIYFALDFLSGQNRANSGELKRPPINVKDKDVVIIGGGDTGSDCLGTSIRQKARSVTQIEIMPEPPAKRSEATPWPDWSYELRTSSSHKEGGERLWSKVIKEFKGKDGVLQEIEMVDAEWKTENGRPVSFTEKPETKTTLKADYVFIAMGFLGVNADSFIKDLGLETDKRGRAASSAAKGIFTCGDTKCGQSLVVRAMTDAKKTADEVNEYLKG